MCFEYMGRDASLEFIRETCDQIGNTFELEAMFCINNKKVNVKNMDFLQFVLNVLNVL